MPRGDAVAGERNRKTPMVRTLLTSTSPVAGGPVAGLPVVGKAGKKRIAQSLVFDSERKAWTVQRWAAEMDVSVPTVWDWIKQGKVPSVKCGGRRLIRISPDDYMDACAAEAAAAASTAAE